jgi:hypothetical protein
VFAVIALVALLSAKPPSLQPTSTGVPTLNKDLVPVGAPRA